MLFSSFSLWCFFSSFSLWQYFWNVLQRTYSVLIMKESMQKKNFFKKKILIRISSIFPPSRSLSRLLNYGFIVKIFFSTKYSSMPGRPIINLTLWFGVIASAQPLPSLTDDPTKQYCVLEDLQKLPCRLSIFTLNYFSSIQPVKTEKPEIKKKKMLRKIK